MADKHGSARGGLVEFTRNRHVTRVMVCSGGGWMSDARVQIELSKRREAMRHHGGAPSVALVAGIQAGPDISPPNDITADSDPDNLVTGPAHLRIVSIAELRANPGLVHEVI